MVWRSNQSSTRIKAGTNIHRPCIQWEFSSCGTSSAMSQPLCSSSAKLQLYSKLSKYIMKSNNWSPTGSKDPWNFKAPYNSLSRQNIAQVNVRFTLDRLGGPENGHVCFGEITNGASWRRNLYVNYSKFRAMCQRTSMCMASKNFCIYYQDLYRDRKIPSHHEIFSLQ